MGDGDCAQKVVWCLMGSTRIVILGYVIMGIFAFIESRQLLAEGSEESYVITEDGTLLVPLVLCIPASIEIDGQITTIDQGEGFQCQQLDTLINACASSLLLSALGGIVYLCIDCLARYGKAGFTLGSANGMAVFYIFILVQAGICTGSLVEQSDFWVKYYIDKVIELDDRIQDVESYANTAVLKVAVLLAFVTAFLILLDAIAYRFLKQPEQEHEEQDEHRIAEENLKEQAIMMEEAANSTQAFEAPSQEASASDANSAGSPSWTHA